MKTFVTAALMLMFAACSATHATDAESGASKTAKSGHEMLKVSEEGFAAMRAIRAARIAIFEGQTMLASDLLSRATMNLASAAKNDTVYVIDEKTITDGKVVEDQSMAVKKNWIPIDGQIALSDTYVATPENAEHIKKANEFFKKGQSKEALEELRLGAIEVTFSRVLMPLNQTMDKVAEATRLMGEHKYYEANLALKAAEGKLVVDSVSLVATPKRSTKSDKKLNNVN